LWLILVHDDRCIIFKTVGAMYIVLCRRWDHPSQELPYIIGGILKVAKRKA